VLPATGVEVHRTRLRPTTAGHAQIRAPPHRALAPRAGWSSGARTREGACSVPASAASARGAKRLVQGALPVRTLGNLTGEAAFPRAIQRPPSDGSGVSEAPRMPNAPPSGALVTELHDSGRWSATKPKKALIAASCPGVR
jgi:hypothetical protein